MVLYYGIVRPIQYNIAVIINGLSPSRCLITAKKAKNSSWYAKILLLVIQRI